MATVASATDVQWTTSYLGTPPSSRRQRDNDAAEKLFALPLAYFSTLPNPLDGKLAHCIVADLQDQECDWNASRRLAALHALKELSRLPHTSRSLSEQQGLDQLISLLRAISAAYLKSSNDHEDLDLILRCLNNVLVLQEGARHTFASSFDGVRCVVELIEKVDVPIINFLSARLVFFATLSPTTVLTSLVREHQLVDVFADRLSHLLHSAQTAETETAITELLKAFFNVSLFYPKLATGQNTAGAVVGEKFDDVLLPFLTPTIHVLTTLKNDKRAVLVSPWTNAIAVLLNYPVKDHEHLWSLNESLDVKLTRINSGRKHAKAFSESSSSSTSSTSAVSERSSESGSRDGATALARSRRKAASLIKQSLSKPSRKRSNEKAKFSSEQQNIASKLLNILDAFLSRYFSSSLDVDDESVIRTCKADDTDVESACEPILLLLRKLADESDAFRTTIKDFLVPQQIDRTNGLDKRKDMTGILVRLMGSQTYSRLARASGEMLLAMCNGQATQMTALIGYGPCAGFLMSIGQAHAMPGGVEVTPTASSSGTSGNKKRPIDPITGKHLPTEEELARQDADAGMRAMTDDEKEAEAERLFGLFDRMNRTGVMSVVDPRQQAVETGRIREIEQEQERHALDEIHRQEACDEADVEREMRAFRQRREKTTKDQQAS